MIVTDYSFDNKKIFIYDDAIKNTDKIYEEVQLLKYDGIGSWDNDDIRYRNSLKTNLSENTLTYKLFSDFLKDTDYIPKYSSYLCHVNLYLPSIMPYYHTDRTDIESLTCLLMLNDSFDWNDGGEFKIVLNDELLSIAPKNGRIIVFSGDLLHSASTFRDKFRYTVVNKLIKNKKNKTLL
jgi:Rps23 Pro-64 3,4-dihydroxylase Tpa1-like proline 4-hydroxylase